VAASISETIAAGTSATPVFFLVGNASSGISTVTATSSLGDFSTNVSLLRTALVVGGPAGIGIPFQIPTGIQNAPLYVETAVLSPSGNPLLLHEPLAPGFSATVNLTSSNTAVGTVTSPIALGSGQGVTAIPFRAISGGVTTVSVTPTNSNFSSGGIGSSIDVTVISY
jgi:hypothetical protein